MLLSYIAPKCILKIRNPPTQLTTRKPNPLITCKLSSRSEVKMIRFFTQMHPRLSPRGSNISRYPECLTIVRGNFVACGTSVRNYAEKTDKQHPEKDDIKAREEKQSMTMPGFVAPEPLRSEGLLTQQIKQQIEEHKKKKEKPTLHNPEGRE